MMFGNVAPAPFSFTCAAAGAATARAAASASGGDFVMVGASYWLERELGREQGLRADRLLRGVRRGLEADVIPVAEQPQVRAQLVGHAPDEPGLLVAHARLRVFDVDAAEKGRLRVGELVHAERTVDVSVDADRPDRPILGDRGFAGECDLLRAVRHHSQEASARAPAGRLAVLVSYRTKQIDRKSTRLNSSH